jgi:two-component system chemotaxis sensor kinase CheA
MEIDHELILQTFFAESEEKLQEMEEAAVALESQAADPELLATLFRNAHTIKGNAGSLGFEELAADCHQLEELLDRLRKGDAAVTPAQISHLLQAIDSLRDLLRAAQTGAPESAAPRAGADDAPVSESAAQRRGRRTLRVDLHKLDQLLDLTGEAAVARGQMAEALAHAADHGVIEEAWSTLDDIFGRLQELVTEIRMVPIGPLFRQQIRAVHDLVEAEGKSARLDLDGEEVEVDASIIEHLRDPLTHLVRNAVDHGIESPDERRALGKDPCGRITLRARHSGSQLVLEIADDGAGLDRARILERARTLAGGEDSERLSDAELFRLVFAPGFTTSSTVSSLSGRGVGLDVVRRNIEALRGSVAIQGAAGAGATVTLRLPLTLAIIDGLLVEAGGEVFVIPLENVVECIDLPPGAPEGRTSGLLTLRGAPLPYLRLREHFALEGGGREGRENVVVVESEGLVAGLAVDALLGKSQTVIKPLGRLFQNVKGLSGSAILGNGRIALIADVAALLREAVRQAARTEEPLPLAS